GVGLSAPLAPFHAAHALGADEIGPGARHGGGFLVAVKIDEHLPLCGFAADTVIVIDQKLIAALHEIDLDALDAPFCVLIEGGLELVVESFPNDPENYT